MLPRVGTHFPRTFPEMLRCVCEVDREERGMYTIDQRVLCRRVCMYACRKSLYFGIGHGLWLFLQSSFAKACREYGPCTAFGKVPGPCYVQMTDTHSPTGRFSEHILLDIRLFENVLRCPRAI